MSFDAVFPDVFKEFFDSLALDWGQAPARKFLEKPVVSLSSGSGSRLPDGTLVSQRPMRIFQTAKTRTSYASYSKKARELLNKKNHPASDDITDALLCACVMAAPDGAARRDFLHECLAKIRPVSVCHYFVSNINPGIPEASFFKYQIGELNSGRLASRCSRASSDFARLYGKQLAGRYALESPSFERSFVDFFDITKRRDSLRTNPIWSELELLYFEGLAAEHFEMMWSHFDRVQALNCALGRGGIDPAIFREKLSRDAMQVAIYFSVRGPERGYVVPVLRALTLQARVPSSGVAQELPEPQDSELGAAIVECAALLQQATRFLSANRFADAALYATICLERLFSERGDIADAVARRTAFLCHRARGLAFEKCKSEMHSLYDARSRFVHDAVSIPQPKAAALLQYARWVLLAIYLLQKGEHSSCEGFMNEWVRQIDAEIEASVAGGSFSEITLTEFGALPAQSVGNSDG
jgi:hypothetical protein